MPDQRLIGREEFLERVLERFPELRSEIEDGVWCGLLHPEMGVFSRYTQRAINHADWDRVEACFHLADELLTRASPQLENALYVSFVENLDFAATNGAQAFARLPPGLRRVWQELDEHLARLAAHASRGSRVDEGKR